MKFRVWLSVFLIAASARLAAGADVNVSAAASLTDALKELAGNYEKESGDHIVFNFAASSLLARQITEGAPADLFFSADAEKMDQLQAAGLIETASRHDLLSNSLVVVAPNESALTLAAPAELLQAKVRKLAVADTRVVPAGIYTRTYLSGLGIWEKLEPKIVPVENVRAALAAVESGNVDAGFVYKTDAAISKKVKVIFQVPAEGGPKIVYPIALVKSSTNPAPAKKFLAFLQGDAARAVFVKYGFLVKF